MSKFKRNIVPLVSVLLVSTFPVTFLYFRNASEVSFQEVLPPLLAYAGFSLFAGLVFLLFTRRFSKAALGAIPALLILENYALIENGIRKLAPFLRYWHVLPILLFLIALAGYALSRLSEDAAKKLVLVFAVVFGGLAAFNAVMAVPKIVARQTSLAMIADKEKGEEGIQPEEGASVDLPNIYYFIFDEYSNFDVLETYFDYDNSAFADFLEERGFAVSKNSVNDSQQTYTIVANYMSLDYLYFDTDPDVVKIDARKNSKLVELLSSSGYSVIGTGGSEEFLALSWEGAAQQKNEALSAEGYDFFTVLLNQTPAYPLLISDAATNPEAQQFMNMRAFFMNTTNLRDIKSRCVITYLKSPHQPFIFREDGRISDVSGWHDWTDPSHYLEQLIYLTTVIEDMVDSILSVDPDCVIILQSDHAARSLQTSDGRILIDKFDRRHILNTVYYRGQDIPEIKGLSGVNTLRFVMSRLLGLEMPELEVPVSEQEF